MSAKNGKKRPRDSNRATVGAAENTLATTMAPRPKEKTVAKGKINQGKQGTTTNSASSDTTNESEGSDDQNDDVSFTSKGNNLHSNSTKTSGRRLPVPRPHALKPTPAHLDSIRLGTGSPSIAVANARAAKEKAMGKPKTSSTIKNKTTARVLW